MVKRRQPPSLQATTIQLLVKMSTNAFYKLSKKDTAENLNRKRILQCKRKRSYSCDDGELKRSHKKRLKSGASSSVAGSDQGRKRVLGEYEDDEGDQTQKKYRRIENATDVHSIKEKTLQVKAKDDMPVNYYEELDEFGLLRKYFQVLPRTNWDQYGSELIGDIINNIKQNKLGKESLKRAIEYVLGGKLCKFSTTKLENMVESVEDNIYNSLKFCRNLKSLEITLSPVSDNGIIKSVMYLQKLGHLHTLCLLPNSKYSYHWALQDISRHCLKLRELKIVYDGDRMTENTDISVLQSCKNLYAIWFFNFGRRSETLSLSVLLKSLRNIKILFHKELPNAILELTNDLVKSDDYRLIPTTPQEQLCCMDSVDDTRPVVISESDCLNLERVDLCWYQRGVGYQLVYVPSSYLYRVAQICPKISLINLIGCTCLSKIINRLPNLQAIILQQTSFASSLRCTLKDTQLEKLTVLRVSDVWDVTYDMISAVANSCPYLQVFSVSCSSLQARGRLIPVVKRPPFPCLRYLTMVPTSLESRPSLTVPSVWQLGKALMRYILQDASLLLNIHIRFKLSDISVEDTPLSTDLKQILCVPRKLLQSIVLEWPPSITLEFVTDILEASPDLSKLGNLTTWPLTNEQCTQLLTSYHHLIDMS